MPLKYIAFGSLILTSIWIDLLTVSNDQILAAKYPFFFSILLSILSVPLWWSTPNVFINTYRTKFGTIRKPLLLEILFLISVKIPFLNMIHQTAELFRVHTHTEYIMWPRCALLIGIIWLLFVRVIKILTDIFNPFITLLYSTLISSQIPQK